MDDDQNPRRTASGLRGGGMTIEQIENLILETVKVKLEPLTMNGHEFTRPILDIVSVHQAARKLTEML